MKKELMNQTEAVQASMGGLLAVEQFLQNHYLFRRNVLNGKIEYVTLPAKDEPEYRELTPEAEMGIKLGLAMKKLGFEQSHPHNVAHYWVIPKIKASMNREAA